MPWLDHWDYRFKGIDLGLDPATMDDDTLADYATYSPSPKRKRKRKKTRKKTTESRMSASAACRCRRPLHPASATYTPPTYLWTQEVPILRALKCPTMGVLEREKPGTKAGLFRR
jgi:hypothetical protein